MFRRRPILIDDLLDHKSDCKEQLLSGKWCVAKTEPLYGIEGIFERAWHAWLVFRDKARAVEYMRDRERIK